MRINIIPFVASRKRVIPAIFLAKFGDLSFNTRKTFVVPIAPLPSFLISIFVNIFTRIYPKGIAENI